MDETANSPDALVPSWRGVYPPSKFANAFVIGLAGLAQAGKTTVADAIVDQLAADPAIVNCQKLAFAGRLKEVLATMIGQDISFNHQENKSARLYGDSDWKARDFLIVFGTELVRKQLGENFWTDIIAHRLAKLTQPTVVVIDDVRFPNELNLTNSLGLTVMLRREGVQKTFEHSSEQPDKLGITTIVDNDGPPAETAAKVLGLAQRHQGWPARAT